ncbi:MAG TPA: hypothetical protein VGZ32_10385 [Actinocrinis sp.]|uniref:WXG100-like domain-containing protein n=1 Tax=Actinocrinis sp. TaxID=1920516 RepID=UPI002DDCF838|nr:hypothetical protein [Actinocrinis sp.]HEV3170738.1 hypothetical protein [Actinocrinis sp.]
MAIDDLPLPVVNFLNVIGVEWPYIDEDTVNRFASLVREFGQAVEQTHRDATATVQGIAQAHQGASTEVLKSGWAHLSSAHVTEIVDGCDVLAVALEGWAAEIVVQKGIAIAELVTMAATFFADQAAAVATLGLAEAAVPVIIAAAKKLAESLIDDLEQYIMGKVIEAAAKPLFAKVEAALSGLDWSQSGASSSSAQGFSLDLQALEEQATHMKVHAETMRAHAAKLGSGIAGLAF